MANMLPGGPRTTDAVHSAGTAGPGRQGAERRLAAIAVLDVVSYSQLMSRDEPGTHARWMRMRSEVIIPSISEHGGSAVTDTGDGFLIEFRSAVAAAEWAADLQNQLRQNQDPEPETDRIRLRIAIHIGEVIADGGNIFGEDVNIAARLQEFAEPGSVLISGAALDRINASRRPAVEPVGPLRLKNVERPVPAFRYIMPGRLAPVDTGFAPTHRPSIAVLPFRVLGETGVDRYIVEGIAHEVVGSLSTLKELFVVASSSTIRIADQADPIDVGRRLGVRYLLTGTISRTRGRLRLMSELNEVQTQSVVWWKRDDLTTDELYAAQDLIAAKVAHHLVPHLRNTEIERAKRKSPDNLDAYDHYLRALHRLYRFTEGDFAGARTCLEKAVELDPDYAPAHAMLAKWHILSVGQGYSTERDASSRAAIACAERAVELAPADPICLAMYGHTLAFMRGSLDEAVRAFERATAAGPNSAIAWAFSSPTYAYLGDGAGAVARAQYALTLSPLDPYAFFFEGILGLAQYFAGAYEESARICYRVLSGNSRFSANMRPLMASLVALDRVAEAHSIEALHRSIEPNFRISSFRTRYPIRKQDQLTLYCERLLRAGVPE